MNLRKLYYLMLIIPLFFFYTGCSDDTTDPPVTVNEAEVLVEYLEANGNPVTTFAAMVKATDVNTNILEGGSWAIIDIRGDAYDAGHIEGAVKVASTDVLEYYEANNLETKEKVVIVCFSGQTAAWVNGLLRTVGKTNTFDLKWGMCSWNPATSGSWTSTDNVNNSRFAEFVTVSTDKAAEGNLPTLTTGKTAAADILRARVEDVFEEGFAGAKVSSDGVYGALSDYYIANYWVETDYSWGHIDGAMQYTPKDGFTSGADLKTLPTDKTVAVYCYTGQTSAHVAAYLRVLGYDAVSILFGVNGMAYDEMPGTKFNPDSEIHEFDLVQ